jgi:3-isopropylmalate/(R)-2-methylmalate dehydratase small subunit
MKRIIRGRVVKLGDNVNTDIIAPGLWKTEGLEVLRLHTMEAICPGFYQRVQPGDIIVAGSDFGCGSHREEATTIMIRLGIAAIVADSLARIYFRNGIAYGIPIFAVDGISAIAGDGDSVEIDIEQDEIIINNLDTAAQITAPPIPETMFRVLEAGGIFPLLKKELEERPVPHALIR